MAPDPAPDTRHLAPERIKMAKKRREKVDGFGPHEKAKVRAAVRQVWHRSHARKLCVQRCTDKHGFAFCEKCKRRCPKAKIDHINQVGEVGQGFLERMFVPSKMLRGLCDKCHNEKTKLERKKAAAKKKAAEAKLDFY